jgi:uncharacterized protein (TIGR02996 family)
MRRFEHPSGKFWSVQIVDARRLEIRWGAIGTPGQAVVRSFESPLAAQNKQRDEIARQIKLGYVETLDAPRPMTPPDRWTQRLETETHYVELAREDVVVLKIHGRLPDRELSRERFEYKDAPAAKEAANGLLGAATADGFRLAGEIHRKLRDFEFEQEDREVAEITGATNPKLEEQCRAAPDDPAPWSVYADWLQEQDDPRGEVAAMCATNPKSAPAIESLRKHRIELFGSDRDGRATRIVGWHHGFPSALALVPTYDDETPLDAWISRLAYRPFMQFVEEWHLGIDGFEGDNDWEPALRELTKSPLGPRVKALHLDEWDEQDISYVSFGDLSKMWDKLPALETLVLKSGMGGTLGTLDLPELKKFVRITGGLALDEISAICNASWPKLEHLEVWFGSSQYGAEVALEHIEMIASSELPALRYLGLCNCELAAEMIPVLARSRLLPQLTTLDLSRGMLLTAGELIAHKRAFEDVQLDLRSNLLSGDHCAALKIAFPSALLDDQRDPEDHYVEVGE